MAANLAEEAKSFLSQKVAASMEGYETREPQLRMAEACADVIGAGGMLVAEAGTGTGKTFAYLVPIVLSGRKAIVSTRTINLQEQLSSKDLRFLSGLRDFRYAVAKGRSNYLCLRRLHAFHPDDAEEKTGQKVLLDWSEETASGDIEEYQGGRRPPVWEKVCADADACRGKKCGHFRKCFYFLARQKWEAADVVVTNHALLAINAMMSDERKLLPKADVLVVDEGHALDAIFSEQIGLNLSDRGFEKIFNVLLRVDQRGAYKGLLAKTPALFPDVEALKVETGVFFSKVRDSTEHRRLIRGRFALAGPVSELAVSIRSLLEKIRASAAGLFTEDEELDLKAAVLRLRSYVDGMETFGEEADGFVRWAEIEERRTVLRMSPVYPAEFVRTNLLPDYDSVILTSATLSVGGDFGLIEGVLGLDSPETLSVPSPFDIRGQTEVSVERGIDLQREDGIEHLARAVLRESTKEEGGTLVLFTSREVMRKTWERSAGHLSDAGLNPMLQGEMPNRMILREMRGSTNSVIFGLDSFWEGVDVRGDALRCLIITKLPFEVPTEPLMVARTEEIRKRGGNPFRDYSLPRAVLKFRQGFGRLIRSKDDRGRVIICDERAVTKDYGRKFMESIG